MGQLLELTVSQLMAGERDTMPQEELLQDSLRLGAAHSGRAKKWRRLFLAAAGLLVALLLLSGYLYVRNHTNWLPQRHTVITPIEIDEMDALVARVAGDCTLSAFDVALADGLEALTLQLELWDDTGLLDTREIFVPRYDGGDYERHQKLVFAFSFQDNDFLYDLTYGGCAISSSLEDLACLESPPAWGFDAPRDRLEVSRETGAILASVSIDGGGGIRTSVTGNSKAPNLAKNQSAILLRLVCR